MKTRILLLFFFCFISFESHALRRIGGPALILHSVLNDTQHAARILPQENIHISLADDNDDPHRRRWGAPPPHNFLPHSPEAKLHSGLVLLITGSCFIVADAVLLLVSVKDEQKKKALGYDNVYTPDVWAFYCLPGELGLSFAIPGIINTIRYGRHRVRNKGE
jgi:hypothetical protein